MDTEIFKILLAKKHFYNNINEE